MKIRDFLNLYKSSGHTQTLASAIKPNEDSSIALKGLSGSLDSVISAAVFNLNHQTSLFILHDKEEAAYFYNDLQNLIGRKEVLFFPSSYKKPYQFEETENANILMRAEILNRVNNQSSTGELIVTYPEALSERVINKRSLRDNTFTVKIGENLDVEFVTELLISYDFEKSDFVFEAGQFAIRGGIIDVYSYANELPYRIELFGDEVESIRSFDPNTQLSEESLKQIHIIPNVQTKLIEEERQGLISFLPQNLKIWMKDFQQVQDALDLQFEKASQEFDRIMSESGNTQVILSPENLFDNSASFVEMLKGKVKIEFGNRFVLGQQKEFNFESASQPSFNKNFTILSQNLSDNQTANISNFICAEQPSQLQRFQEIFDEIDPLLEFQDLNIGLRKGFVDKIEGVACYTDHEIFERFHRYKLRERYTKSKALTLKELKTLQAGDYVTHIDYGIGRFAGLHTVEAGGRKQEAVRLIYRDDDLLFVSVHSLHKISKYSGKEGVPPVTNKLGSPEWENKKKRVKKKVVDIAKDLINLYAKRKNAPGFAHTRDSFLQAELESSFIYEDTVDQGRATEEVKADMELPHPMDRLVCGDVGFGKTEVAIRAAFKAVTDGKQVAVLVPTTILAMQHYRTFINRYSDFPVEVQYINRFKSPKNIKDILEKTKEGKLDILIGTHRIVNKDVVFKDLGLLVIDEEQKFGVKVKERLKEIKVNVDVLTLTATPIPRTLHFSLMGARDLSIIQTPPPNRQPVTTEVHTFNEKVIRDALSFEIRRGGQVFFVHNRISDIEEIANIVLKLVPDARIGVAHGQMEGHKLEKAMVRYIEGEYDILVSTNIIESGLDIPNANTIIINSAHMFGLSDLHQMRGRVGRSNRKAFCYLLTPPTIHLTAEARKRLRTLEEFSELGDGFKVAMRDLDIRGAGNLLGAEQSGFISDLGFEMYHKILDEAVQELKETEFKDLFASDLTSTAKSLVRDCAIETDLEVIIPEDYVNNISERLSLYNELDNIKEEEGLTLFANNLTDRFGPYPDTVVELIESVRLRWKAERLGFEKITLKNESMKGYFLSRDNETYFNSEIFGGILNYVNSNPRKCRMKEHRNKLILTVDEVRSIDEATVIVNEMKSDSLETV